MGKLQLNMSALKYKMGIQNGKQINKHSHKIGKLNLSYRHVESKAHIKPV